MPRDPSFGLLLLTILVFHSVQGQVARYRYPLDIAPRLNANYGEMRPNHFHMGLDLFTERRTGLPVVAAADGYVGRVKIESGGFGRAIYLYHPDGTTTLYAHMERFWPALEEAVRRRQYETESWQQEWELPAMAYPVRRGQYIGNSGNTGASEGPHVHFEVRETQTDRCLNPLVFGLPLPDAVPPVIRRLAVYDRRRSIYEQAPSLHAVGHLPQGNRVPGIIRVATDRVSVAIDAYDRLSGSPSLVGIYEAILWEGDRPLAGFRLDKMGYEATRYLNAHADFTRRARGMGWLQFLLPLPGDTLSSIRIYDSRMRELWLPDTLPRSFRITVKDVAGNGSECFFTLQRTTQSLPSLPAPATLMAPGQMGIFETPQLQVVLDEWALYDTIHFEHSQRLAAGPVSFSSIHALHRQDVPTHTLFTVRLAPDRLLPSELADRLVIRRSGKGSPQVRKATAEGGWYTARFRDFGDFQLLADTTPPTISFPRLRPGGRLSGSSIQVRVTDNLGAIRLFRAALDGRWLLFAQQGGSFTYRVDDRCPPGRHTLRVSVEDEAGNKTVQQIVFIR